MESNVILMFEYLVVGCLIGIMINSLFNSQTEKPKKYNIVEGVKTVLSIYLIILVLLISFEIVEIFDPEIRFPDFLDTDIIGILSAFGSVFLGAMAVIISAGQHRERQRQEILDEIIGPLYFEIQHLLDNLLADTSQSIYQSNIVLEQWNKISGTYNELRAKKIDANIPFFYNTVIKFTSTLQNIKWNLDRVLNQYFNDFVLNPIGYSVNTDRTSHFGIRYSTKLETKSIHLSKSVIFGNDPMSLAEQDPLFDEENCTFTYEPITGPKDNYGNIVPIEVRYPDAKEAFQEMLSVLESDISKENHIQMIREQRLELMDLAADILFNLE